VNVVMIVGGYSAVIFIETCKPVLQLRLSVCVGREIIVGLSGRTNMLGAQAVAKAFPDYPTTIVRVTAPAVHLKDYISMAGPEVMTVGSSDAAQQTFLVITMLLLSGVVSKWL